MAEYTILQEWNVSIKGRGLTSRRADVLIDVSTQDEATNALTEIAQEMIGENDRLVFYAYLEEIARKWRGWIARVEYRADGVPAVYFDNNPELREALYTGLDEVELPE